VVRAFGHDDGWLRETELVPKTQGVVSAVKQTKFALGLLKKGKVPPPFPPHVAERVGEARALYKPRQGAGPRRRAQASSRASMRSAGSSSSRRRVRA
jgi:hypothetical protein